MKTASVSLAVILLFTPVTTGCFSLPNNKLVQSIVKQVISLSVFKSHVIEGGNHLTAHLI